jgi:hypothetical protein
MPRAKRTFTPRRAVCGAVSTAPKSFRGECPKCDKVANHEEFFRERRVAQSERAARSGEFRAMEEYSFRCTACGARNDKVLDEAGVLHKWQGSRHITMKVVGDD